MEQNKRDESLTTQEKFEDAKSKYHSAYRALVAASPELRGSEILVGFSNAVAKFSSAINENFYSQTSEEERIKKLYLLEAVSEGMVGLNHIKNLESFIGKLNDMAEELAPERKQLTHVEMVKIVEMAKRGI